jgi:SAM-dependent methyltransferase
MERKVEPELLDALPADDARAVHSRRDLRRINRWMGHDRLLAKRLSRRPAPEKVVDLGCGDGSLLLKVASRVAPMLSRTELVLVDRQPVVSPQTLAELKRFHGTVRVETADVVAWLESSENTPRSLMVANLFLHHFQSRELERVLSAVAARTRWFIALEPRRNLLAWGMSCLVGIIGCNAVTRHDARVSVRAGFRKPDLTNAWPQGNWTVVESPAGWCSHIFEARGST